MTAKQQTEILMNELFCFAEKMLSEYGEFHPFGGYLKSSGEVVHVGVQSSRDNKRPQQKIDALIRSFKQLAAQGKAMAFGVVVDVMLPNADGSKGDAIKFLLEHQDGYCAEVFFRYAINDGNVEIIEITAQEGESIFFSTMH
jgi:hypothetical protein